MSLTVLPLKNAATDVICTAVHAVNHVASCAANYDAGNAVALGVYFVAPPVDLFVCYYQYSCPMFDVYVILLLYALITMLPRNQPDIFDLY